MSAKSAGNAKTTSTAKPVKSTRSGIDLERVIQVAVTLANQQGFENVTLASVAAELGIRIPSLYNYVEGLPGLQYQMRLWGLRQLDEQIRRAAVGKSGDQAIRTLADAYRAFARAYPGIYTATLRAARSDEPELTVLAEEMVKVMMIVLEAYHLSGDEALHAVRAMRSVFHGFVDLEAAGGFGLPLDTDESFRRLIEMLIQGLNAQRREGD